MTKKEIGNRYFCFWVKTSVFKILIIYVNVAFEKKNHAKMKGIVIDFENNIEFSLTTIEWKIV